jgi:hypothetical protein
MQFIGNKFIYIWKRFSAPPPVGLHGSVLNKQAKRKFCLIISHALFKLTIMFLLKIMGTKVSIQTQHTCQPNYLQSHIILVDSAASRCAVDKIYRRRCQVPVKVDTYLHCHYISYSRKIVIPIQTAARTSDFKGTFSKIYYTLFK